MTLATAAAAELGDVQPQAYRHQGSNSSLRRRSLIGGESIHHHRVRCPSSASLVDLPCCSPVFFPPFSSLICRSSYYSGLIRRLSPCSETTTTTMRSPCMAHLSYQRSSPVTDIGSEQLPARPDIPSRIRTRSSEARISRGGARQQDTRCPGWLKGSSSTRNERRNMPKLISILAAVIAKCRRTVIVSEKDHRNRLAHGCGYRWSGIRRPCALQLHEAAIPRFPNDLRSSYPRGPHRFSDQ